MKYIVYTLLFLPAFVHISAQDAVKSIDSLLHTCYRENEPGAMVLISYNRQTIFKKGYGLANTATRAAINSRTLFNIGSITKQFTAFAILQMAANKQLSLNDRLTKYFPGFNPKTGNRITLRHLLTHSSGIADHYAYTDTNRVKHAGDKDVLAAVKHIDTTYFTAGTQYRYSNTAYCLLALVIEKISGMSYQAYIRKNIFMPLHMQHSVVLQPGFPVNKSALGYDFDSNRQQFNKLDAAESIFFSTEGDGGIYTSADEYLRWWQSLQQPSPASRATVQKARSPQFSVDSSQRLFYGYGWFVSDKDSIRVVSHTGSNGGFRAMVFTIPAKNYMVVIFSNRTGIDLEKLVQQINDILHITNNSFTKTAALVSCIHSSPIFAPCKEII